MTTTTAKKHSCFGFYNDSVVCGTCVATNRCRAIMISDGSGIVEALLEEVIAGDPGGLFPDVERPSELVAVLLNTTSRRDAVAQQGVIDDLFGPDDEADGGIFGADLAAKSNSLSSVGQAMARQDKGILQDIDDLESEPDSDEVDFM